MGWTEERVEVLKKLWSDGLSASQIAGRLGGVTRNAVIGKVHRLGLSGRATTSRMRSARPRLRIAATANAQRPQRPTYATVGNAALKVAFAPARPEIALMLVPNLAEVLDDVPVLKVDLLDLKECMCRWPLGDPQSEGFAFCGRPKTGGASYCEHHAGIAYYSMQRRRK